MNKTSTFYAADLSKIREQTGNNARRAALDCPLTISLLQHETAIHQIVAQYQPF